MRISSCILVLSALLASASYSQIQSPPIDDFSNHGEVYFILGCGSLDHLPLWISIDKAMGKGMVTAYAREEKLTSWMGHMGDIEIIPLPHPSTLTIPVMKNEVDIHGTVDWDFYPTYEAYVDIMYQFQDDYPDLCQVISIGQSAEGREILAAVVSSTSTGSGEKPQILYTSGIHGDETTGYVLFLRLIDFLLENYNSDLRVKNLVDHTELWVSPLANPDGTYASGNNTVYGATRFNANGIDLNRNYPDPEDGDHPDENDWQVETIHFMNLAQNNHFVLGTNVHGGAEVFNYPWDTWPQLHADDDWWYFVAREWVDTIHAYGPPGYFDGFDNGISNGYAWYSVSGGRQDYMNYFHHCREFTLEISNTKLLPADQLPAYWEYNYRSFLNFLDQSLYGIHGRIVDGGTGDPLKASVFIEMHDMDESWIVSNDAGWYFRPLFEGIYDLTFFAPGYELLTIPGITVDNYNVTVVDVELSYSGSGTGELILNDLFSIQGNPGYGWYGLNYHGDHAMQVELQVIDGTGMKSVESSCNFSPGSHAYVLDISNHQPGLYILLINSGGVAGMFKLIKI